MEMFTQTESERSKPLTVKANTQCTITHLVFIILFAEEHVVVL